MACIITLIICCGFAAMFLYVGAMQFWQQRRNLAHARPVDAVIVHSAVKTSKTRDTDQRVGFSNSTTSYLPEVRFQYGAGASARPRQRRASGSGVPDCRAEQWAGCLPHTRTAAA